MDISELKAEAQRLGFSISKKITYEKVSRCCCGSKLVRCEISYPRGKYYRCVKCGYKSKPAKYKYQAIINWNNAVRDFKAYHEYQEEKFKELMEKWDMAYYNPTPYEKGTTDLIEKGWKMKEERKMWEAQNENINL